VAVHRLLARLFGESRQTLAETIVEVTRDLGGVVGVESRLTWEIDDVQGLGGPAEPDVLMTLSPH